MPVRFTHELSQATEEQALGWGNLLLLPTIKYNTANTNKNEMKSEVKTSDQVA